jgi:hypothetical protein
MSQISRICPVTDAEAERIVRPATLADLAGQITASPAQPSPAQPSQLTAGREGLIRRIALGVDAAG